MDIPKFEVGKITIGQLVDTVVNQFGESAALKYPTYGIDYNYKDFQNLKRLKLTLFQKKKVHSKIKSKE